MIELQCINNILAENNIDSYLEEGINADFFPNYTKEWNYILEHYKKYGKVPDQATFLANFTEFDLLDVLEPQKYLLENLREDYVFRNAADLFNESVELLKQNAFEGLRNILSKGEKLLVNNSITQGTDINNIVNQKIADINSKKGTEGILGISTGLKELDDILGGWLPGEELVTIVGRVNQGKSWLLQKFLTAAHSQGKRILLYSGEMSAMQVGYRHDTLALNYSNRQLTRGTISDVQFSNYENDLQERANSLQPFIVVTPKDLGGKYMTVSTLKALIKKYTPDIVGIDQLSLMDDERKGENRRLQLSNITMDLFRISEELGLPILADAQANRNKTNTEEPENPELADIGESDAIGQNSSRVISLVQTKLGLSLLITKNRYGENNKKFIYSWDIDLGTFRFVSEEGQIKSEPELPFKNNSTNIPTGIPDVTDVF
jgi:replicative DNA helicase